MDFVAGVGSTLGVILGGPAAIAALEKMTARAMIYLPLGERA
jgi:hypothetical protein